MMTTARYEDKLYYPGDENSTYMRNTISFIVGHDWSKLTMAILVMHLLLVRVLEGFAVATVSTHTHTYTHIKHMVG